jgi:hypothetical protein
MGLDALIDLISPYAVRAAATLRLADRIADGTTTTAELARAAGADPDALGRLLAYLSARGVFARRDDGGWALTPDAELLRDEGLRAWLDIDGVGGRMDAAVPGLLESIRTGEAAYPRVHGRAIWDDDDAQLDAMWATHCASFAQEAATARAWTGHVVDVGGGTGTLLAAILAANPGTRGTLVERPETVARAIGGFDAVAGSFFHALPPGGDAYVLSQVLHDWPDAEAVAILHRCAEAAGRGGRVVVIERLLEGDDAEMTGMDLRMLLVFGSRERSAADVAALAARAGLALTGVTRTPSGFALVDLEADHAVLDDDGERLDGLVRR